MKSTLVVLLSTTLLVLGCSKSEPPAPVAAASVTPVAAPSAAPVASAAPDPAASAVDTAIALNNTAAAAPAAAAKAVPTEADYEVKAQSTITPANAAQVLAAIEAQVGK